MGTKVEINNFLYMDDGAFAFASREITENAAQIICDHFQHFGLTVHTGSHEKKASSKTEAVYFPPSLRESKEQEDVPPEIQLKDGKFIPFTKAFKYLGSIISHDLTEDLEIESRIKKASQQMGALYQLWNCKDADLQTKQWVYLAGPLNTLLWGAESWNLSARNLSKLRSFHHSAIRRILRIRWEQVKEERITNAEVRERFLHIPDIDSFIIRRTWRYIGKIYREENSLPKKLLGAWIHCPRKIGAPQLSCKKHFATVISTVIPEVTTNANFKEWAPLALQDNKWNSIIDEFFESTKTYREEDEEREQEPSNPTIQDSDQTAHAIPRVSAYEFYSALSQKT